MPPSSRVTTGVAGVTGSSSRYVSMTPAQPISSVPVLVAHDAQDPAHVVDDLSSRNPAMVRLTSPSRATWVRKTSRASSPSPTCSMERIDTPLSPNTWATAASTPGRSATSMFRYHAQHRSSAGRMRGRTRATGAAGLPLRRWWAASMRSPRTADAVGRPPAPRP